MYCGSECFVAYSPHDHMCVTAMKFTLLRKDWHVPELASGAALAGKCAQGACAKPAALMAA